MFSDQKEIKVELNNRKKSRKSGNIYKLNNAPLNNL